MEIDQRDFREWESFAKKLAARYAAPGIDLADLEQEAVLALLEELPEFTPDLGVSLRVFLGRGIRNKLASLYRKTLNLVQLEQFWMVVHKSGDKELNVRVGNRGQAEAVIRRNPHEYVTIKHVKVLAPIGPSLDEEVEEQGESASTRHEQIGAAPDQEWQLAAKQRVAAGVRGSRDVREILTMREQGCTFSQIGKTLGKSTHAVMMAWRRAQGKAA